MLDHRVSQGARGVHCSCSVMPEHFLFRPACPPYEFAMFAIESYGKLRPRVDEYVREAAEISAASGWAPDSVPVMNMEVAFV